MAGIGNGPENGRSKLGREAAGNHSPVIRLQAAQARHEAATEACPHWDLESDGDRADCCWDVAEAARELRLARKAVRQ